ncbi:glycosyltransferase family 2 protein [candidate division WOR-3 bacterium]|nr:glycosyltransferase family 2 protein [candidate division WOR-3 bacterium]
MTDNQIIEPGAAESRPQSGSESAGDAALADAGCVPVEVSVIVPAYNEVDSVELLIGELAEKLGPGYEVVYVDDGSFDGTWGAVQRMAEKHRFLKLCRHHRNQGKTAAILTGFRAASGDIISVFDADLQFDPEDVVRQVAKLKEGFDVVTGEKRGHYDKRFVSSVYNRLARLVFQLNVKDINALKTFRREVLEEIHLRKDWHRYIVPLAAARGFAVGEIPVLLRPRRFGNPKFSGPFRIVIGLFDLVAVGFQTTFMRKPMLYFGSLGSLALGAGLLAGLVAIVLRLFGHGFRPLLYLVILLVVAGLVLFAAGLLGESLATISDRVEEIEKRLKDEGGRMKPEGRSDG